MDSRTSPAGINRRELIKRAAAGGAIAWTAPVILDSLASPAGALTLNECYRSQFDRSGLTYVEVVPDNGAGCVPSTCWNNRTAFTGGLISIAGSDGLNWTFTITAPGCVFTNDSQARVDSGDICVCSTSGAGTSSITFPGTADGTPFDRFKFIIQCAGASCSPCTNSCSG